MVKPICIPAFMSIVPETSSDVDMRQWTFCSLMGQSSEMELEMTYMRIRMSQPDLVYEIGPNYGFSTIFIMWALHDNRKGRMYSFDVHQKYHNAANCIGGPHQSSP